MRRSHKQQIIFLLAFFWLILSGRAVAISGVHPTGVNVNARAPSSVFLTFQGLGIDETSSQSFWCGELVGGGLPNPTTFNPCRSDTILGFMPQANNLTRQSGTAGVRNLTDIMTIPASVVRRAFQRGQQGENATFFYVRRFIENGNESYVRVTCRMTGGGARVPLSITGVEIGFVSQERPVYHIAETDPLPRFGAQVRYNGSGRLKGRWELVMPGDPEPREFDLLPESSLPIEQRVEQNRYTLLGRFDQFLPPTGAIFIEGPDPSVVPRNANGPYKILMRVEATDDKEGNSNTLAGVVTSGGVAGFAIPPLRYYQSSSEASGKVAPLELKHPVADAQLTSGSNNTFTWYSTSGASLYRLEIGSEGSIHHTAYIEGDKSNYSLPPWLGSDTAADESWHWRVVALTKSGKQMAASDWQGFRFTD